MKAWHKLPAIAICCVLCFFAGIQYSGGNETLVRCLLSCIAILLMAWFQFSAEPTET